MRRAVARALAALIVLAVLSCGRARREAVPSARVFQCGDTPCDARTSYCETLKTDYAPLPSTHSCKPLPASCRARSAEADCGCFPRGTRCDFCSRVEKDGVRYFQRTCIGGY